MLQLAEIDKNLDVLKEKWVAVLLAAPSFR